MKTVCASLAMLAFAGAACAQSDSMAKDNMSSSSSMHMSKSQMAMMNKCKGMSHDAMMKNKTCMAMMKAHPDMMKSDDSMGH
ncbi:MAG: hypothetical protein ACR2F8_01985 [Caulobacteraceae bacterium]